MQEDGANRRQKAFWFPGSPSDEPAFDEQWPTETKGDGKLVANNFRTGAAQGKSSMVRKAHCMLCGWPNDIARIDHSGGSLDGLGAGGGIVTQTVSANTSATNNVGKPIKHTENIGTQSYRNASGCSLCFSKNSTKMRQDAMTQVDSWSRLRLTGFMFLGIILVWTNNII